MQEPHAPVVMCRPRGSSLAARLRLVESCWAAVSRHFRFGCSRRRCSRPFSVSSSSALGTTDDWATRVIAHELPLFLAWCAGFLAALPAIFGIPKMRALALREARQEYAEYYFLFPLFLSMTLLTTPAGGALTARPAGLLSL